MTARNHSNLDVTSTGHRFERVDVDTGHGELIGSQPRRHNKRIQERQQHSRDTDPTAAHTRRSINDHILEHFSKFGKNRFDARSIRQPDHTQPMGRQEGDVQRVRTLFDPRVRVILLAAGQPRQATLDVPVRRVGANQTHRCPCRPAHPQCQLDRDTPLRSTHPRVGNPNAHGQRRKRRGHAESNPTHTSRDTDTTSTITDRTPYPTTPRSDRSHNSRTQPLPASLNSSSRTLDTVGRQGARPTLRYTSNRIARLRTPHPDPGAASDRDGPDRPRARGPARASAGIAARVAVTRRRSRRRQ